MPGCPAAQPSGNTRMGDFSRTCECKGLSGVSFSEVLRFPKRPFPRCELWMVSKKIQANNDFSSHSSFYASSKHYLGDFLKHFASCSHSVGSYGAQISSQSACQKHRGPQHGCTGVTLIPTTFRASSPGRKPAWVCARNSPKPLPPLAPQAPLRPRTLCRGPAKGVPGRTAGWATSAAAVPWDLRSAEEPFCWTAALG